MSTIISDTTDFFLFLYFGLLFLTSHRAILFSSINNRSKLKIETPKEQNKTRYVTWGGYVGG